MYFALACTATAQTLTLDQALELAELNNPQLRAAAAQIEGSTAAITTARAYPNPEFNFLAGRQAPQTPGANAGPVPAYTLSQPLEFGALRPSRIQLAERGRQSSQFGFAEVRLAVLSFVRRAFFQVLRRKGEIGIGEENLRVVEDLRDRIRVRVNVGEAGRLELVRAEAEVATARTSANSTRVQLVSALSQFRAAVGAPLAENLDVAGALDPPVMLPPLEDLRKEALSRHPSLQLATSEIQRARARVDYEKALRRPQPFLRTEVDFTNPSYRVGLGIVLPTWNQRQGPIAEAAATLRQTNSISQTREIQIIAALEGAYGRYQVVTQQLAAFEQGLLQEAEEAVRAAETAYLLGERGVLEVLDAQRVLRVVRLDFLNAQFDRQAALIDLDELRAVDLRRQTP
jgi:outer membrane protein, heavy metal efflux system